MRTDWLSVALVEEIHRVVLRGRPVADVVNDLKGATLPGLLEYGCLRQQYAASVVPPLPKRVLDTDLGQGLNAVCSRLGIRSSGPEQQPSRRLDPRAAEFHVLNGPDDLESDAWSYFAGRFDASARNVELSFDAAARLQLALYEMAENAVIHAESPAILVGYHAAQGNALFSVVDVGIGVLASLRKNPAYRNLEWHDQAIKTALKDGVSSCASANGGGGFGFRKVFQSLTDQWGSLRFRSGESCVTMDGTNLDANVASEYHPPPMPGFQVTVCCRNCAPTTEAQAYPQI